MTEEESSNELKFENLPYVVLLEILSHLGVKERRLGIGSTCSYFSDMCDNFQMKKQKFLFQSCDYIDRDEVYECVYEFVTNRRISIMNLEFHNLHPGKANLDTWIETGWKIHSLVLSQCYLDDYIIKSFIQCCPNLNELRIINCKRGSRNVKNTIYELVEDGIQHAHMQTFQFAIYIHFSKEFYENVFKLFPNLRSIACGMNITARRTDIEDITSEFTRIDECLTTKVRKLTFYVPSDGSWMRNLSKDHKFTELETIYRYSERTIESFFRFLENQNQLERLHLYVSVTQAHRIAFYCRLMNCLKRSTSLKHLKLLGPDNEIYEADTRPLRNLANTKLSNVENRILDSLKVDILRTPKKAYLNFYFTNLKCLEIRIRKTAHLQQIFQTQVNLKKLILREFNTFYMQTLKTFGEGGPNNQSAICRLTQLEHFGIHNGLFEINLLKELKLPKLKILEWPGKLLTNLFLPEIEYTRIIRQYLTDTGVEWFPFMMVYRRFRRYFTSFNEEQQRAASFIYDYDRAKEIFYFKASHGSERKIHPEEAVTLAQLTQNCPELEYIYAENCIIKFNRYYKKLDLYSVDIFSSYSDLRRGPMKLFQSYCPYPTETMTEMIMNQ